MVAESGNSNFNGLTPQYIKIIMILGGQQLLQILVHLVKLNVQSLMEGLEEFFPSAGFGFVADISLPFFKFSKASL